MSNDVQRLEIGQSRIFYPRFSCAFSLVEVVLALGIATFAILAIIALLPVGIKSTKDSLDETGALNVLSEVIADRRATPFSQSSTLYQLPALTNTLLSPVTNYFGINDNNRSTGTTLTQARYRVDCVVIPPISGRLDPYQAYLKVTWPAGNTTNGGYLETVVTFPHP